MVLVLEFVADFWRASLLEDSCDEFWKNNRIKLNAYVKAASAACCQNLLVCGGMEQ
jgi:hypothetical protein